ncbi:hypothetical protein [uncultured Kocuria sp.]|uniref:hypothetical protein n=1 Tax=uncultured Kocuria sp. TaxID=259305 RepID=UPI00066054CC|nr:hypothetical protein [uncultured Kocuria sp.]MCT1368069.1 hypothetical protein [Rothia sp. p3-SID1597]
MKNEKKNQLYGITLLIVIVLGALILAYFTVWPLIIQQYNKSHFVEKTCSVEEANYTDGGSFTGGGGGAWLELKTKECGDIKMRKTNDGKSVGDLRKMVKSGKVYKFQFGDLKFLGSSDKAQNVEEIN